MAFPVLLSLQVIVKVLSRSTWRHLVRAASKKYKVSATSRATPSTKLLKSVPRISSRCSWFMETQHPHSISRKSVSDGPGRPARINSCPNGRHRLGCNIKQDLGLPLWTSFLFNQVYGGTILDWSGQTVFSTALTWGIIQSSQPCRNWAQIAECSIHLSPQNSIIHRIGLIEELLGLMEVCC